MKNKKTFLYISITSNNKTEEGFTPSEDTKQVSILGNMCCRKRVRYAVPQFP